MGKFKKCPGCGKHNPPNMLECLECETDLTSIRAMGEGEKSNIDNEVTEASVQEEYERICDCGCENSANARRCKTCGEEISDIAPTPNELNSNCESEIVSIDGKYIFEISENEVIIGRECQMKEYLSDKCYVSRQHAIISKVSEKIFIDNLSKTNCTFINNKKITERTEVLTGDEIGLGGNEIEGNRQDGAAYFVLRKS